ncbi:protein of unknown function [Paraburkholderia dioscoreae]|uniref:Uncharacterized protein n=1 Tax=Paraburkholderia dioscoreae TaxID=2604047 RepID=A0A5Q4ZF94_9BURK|nr:protein of unknown function [Paraburkholderia dioscoreae]
MQEVVIASGDDKFATLIAPDDGDADRNAVHELARFAGPIGHSLTLRERYTVSIRVSWPQLLHNQSYCI